MAGEQTLSQRIKAEFESRESRAKSQAQARSQEAQEKEKRLTHFARVCDDLKSVWGPSLEAFAKQMGDKIKVTPTLTPSAREAKVAFLTDLASITLTLSVAADSEVQRLVLDYDLLIVPMFFKYDRSSRLEMPIDRVDKDAIRKWIDDRLVSCVQAYLSIQDNEYYRKRAAVEDPITKQSILREDAAATLEHNGQTYYFASKESLAQFKQKMQIAQPAAAKAKAPPGPEVVSKPTAGAGGRDKK